MNTEETLALQKGVYGKFHFGCHLDLICLFCSSLVHTIVRQYLITFTPLVLKSLKLRTICPTHATLVENKKLN